MNRTVLILLPLVALATLGGCKQPAGESSTGPTVITSADLSAMADAVPKTGPREGNNYKVFFLVLRQNQAPAAGFHVDMHVKGKSEPKTYTTDQSGLIKADDLPFPGMKNQLVAVLHYFSGKEDQPREIVYPFIESDAYRLKDIQYIPNTVTPDGQ